MKKQGKHIQYLKKYMEFIVNHISVIVLTIFLYFLFSYFDEVSSFYINLLYKIEINLFSNVDPQNYQEVYNTSSSLAIIVLSAIISVLAEKLVSIILKKKKYVVKVRRYIYYQLRKWYLISDKWIMHTIIPKLINVFLHGKPLNYYNQANHISQLMRYLKVDDNEKHIVWIKGNAYSGKTTIIFRFIEEISNKKNFKLFEEYEKHIYYFDLGTSSLNINNIHKSICDRKYENALLILDNIHKLELSDLRIFVSTLENYHENIKFLICLSRQFEEFCFSQEINERLDSFARNYSKELNINPIHNDTSIKIDYDKYLLDEIYANTKSNEKNYQEFCKRVIKKEHQMNIALIVQCYNLYLSTLGARNRKFIYKVFDALNTGEGDISLKYTLSFIIHATLFSGGFETGWFNEYINGIKEKKTRYYSKKYFRLLLKNSFISIVCSSNSDEVVFHESLARYYFELIGKKECYRKINFSVIKYLVEKNIECNRTSNAWKYKILLLPTVPNDNTLFDKALCIANFKTLLEDLQYIIKEKNFSEILFYRELGILFDRFGKLNIATEYFKKALDQKFSPAIYINLIQVDHGAFDDKVIQSLIDEKNDTYIRVAAEYWKAHIDMHDGKFQFNDFAKLLDDWKEHKDEIIEMYPYDGLHLMRRWYFDCFRVYYLSGILNPELLKPIIQADLFKNISYLPEFEAFRYKFQCAFFLHYDVLFEKGILNIMDYEKVKEWDGIMLGQNFYDKIVAAQEHGESEINIIINEAIEYYSASSNGLKKIMDKSYRYSDLRVCELKLAYDNVDLDVIFANERFIKYYIKHSMSIQVDEYIAYGYTYLLKNYLVGQYCLSSEYDDNPHDKRILQNVYITNELIQDCFINIERYHNIYRGERQNNYCLLRLNIYKTLYDYSKNIIKFEQAEKEIKKLYNDAKQQGYCREKILLNYLLENKLRRVDIIKFYKYYPLVMQ
ncbi:MAG: hypothetical protein NC489_37970 [Ruminococcus flavefaciens]|nr:hypothetical protein [Ruminococcus flavefaciens]